MSKPSFYLQGYADAKPSEAIQPHELPGLAVAVVFPGKAGADVIDIPIKQFKDYRPRAKGSAARSLAKWLRGQSSDGLHLTGFFQVADQVEAAICGLSLLEELPETRVVPHFDTFRLYFGNNHIDFAQAVALEYYELTINLGVLRAGLRLPVQFRRLFVAMDRFPGRSPKVSTPGTPLETTPGVKFLNFVREHSSTGQHIRREYKSVSIIADLGTIDWWRPSRNVKWRQGKSHPYFVLPDWLAAAALAESYPDAFADSFDNTRMGADAVDGLRELYKTFKDFDLWSMTEAAGYIQGSTQSWSVPDDARAFILDRAKKR